LSGLPEPATLTVLAEGEGRTTVVPIKEDEKAALDSEPKLELVPIPVLETLALGWTTV